MRQGMSARQRVASGGGDWCGGCFSDGSAPNKAGPRTWQPPPLPASNRDPRPPPLLRACVQCAIQHCDSCWADASACNYCQEGFGLDQAAAACQPCPEGCSDCYPATNGTSQGCRGDYCREGYEFEDCSAATLVCVPLTVT